MLASYEWRHIHFFWFLKHIITSLVAKRTEMSSLTVLKAEGSIPRQTLAGPRLLGSSQENSSLLLPVAGGLLEFPGFSPHHCNLHLHLRHAFSFVRVKSPSAFFIKVYSWQYLGPTQVIKDHLAMLRSLTSSHTQRSFAFVFHRR